MAKVIYNGTPEILTHSVNAGTGKPYVFHRGRATEVKDKVDVAHYMTSGGFQVELSMAEAAYYLLNRDRDERYHLSDLKDKDIAAMAGVSLRKVKAAVSEIKLPKKPEKAPQSEDEYLAELEKKLEGGM